MWPTLRVLLALLVTSLPLPSLAQPVTPDEDARSTHADTLDWPDALAPADLEGMVERPADDDAWSTVRGRVELAASLRRDRTFDGREGTTGMLGLSFAFDAPPRVPRMYLAQDTGPTRGAARKAARVPTRLIRSTLRAAFAAAGLGASDSALDGVLSRSRWSALLPEVRLRGAQYAGLESVLYQGATATTNRDQARDTLTLEARLGWRLDRLVYGGDEPSLERLRSQRLELRLRLAHKVLAALVERQRALFDLQRFGEGPEADDAALRLGEAEATLDVLTGGVFGASQHCSQPCTDGEER